MSLPLVPPWDQAGLYDTSTLKALAPAVRRQVTGAIGRKLDVVLAVRSPDYRPTDASQVRYPGFRRRTDSD